MMTDEFWIYSWGFVGIPSKDINIPFKEFYQFFSPLMRQLKSNMKKLFWVVPITTFTKSSHFASSAGLSMDNAEDFNCYNPFSPCAEDSASGLYLMATTMHYLTIA